jgi:hypothetical protein
MPPGEPRSREKLAGLLWSDRSDKQARDSLKHYRQDVILGGDEPFQGIRPLITPGALH